MRILVTGAAGFIGYHVAARLLAEGHDVLGLDGFTPYYDPALKRARRDTLLAGGGRIRFVEMLLEDRAALEALFAAEQPDVVVHLAAQPGVRYSLENPRAYMSSNVDGTFNLLEACRAHRPRHLLAASTSSVYGANAAMPFRETDPIASPLTLYAATKAANESMGHAYAHLWSIPTTMFRFFTVYGPWGRPDMAAFSFADAIANGRPIHLHNEGRMSRDFTYVGDIVEGITRLVACVPPGPSDRVGGAPGGDIDSLSPAAPFRVVNIGLGRPVALMDFVRAIESALDQSADIRLKPMQPGEVLSTFASVDLLERLTGFRPSTTVEEGMRRFVAWYRDYAGRSA